jgi:hypothetical protein
MLAHDRLRVFVVSHAFEGGVAELLGAGPFGNSPCEAQTEKKLVRNLGGAAKAVSCHRSPYLGRLALGASFR